jgi:cytochrome c biogenesis protein CcdA
LEVLLLNLMPCVLPVLAIKLLSLTQQQVTPAMRRGIGLGYAAGVMLSMLGLAALVLGLRAAGQQLGWGFQLQSPTMVIALAVLFTLIALNLFGVLELRGAWASGLAAQLARHPLADAFLSGVLAVVVAAPCTAPFMGASVGLAFTLPMAQALLIFISLGLGLALPFGLACWWPVAARMAAATRRLDGHVAPSLGLSYVGHGGLAAVGAGPANQHRCQRCLAGGLGGGQWLGLGTGFANQGQALADRCVCGWVGLVALGVGTGHDPRSPSGRSAASPGCPHRRRGKPGPRTK